MNINKILKKIEKNYYNIQDVINCCCISIDQLNNSNKTFNIHNFIICLILNLYYKEQILEKYKTYYFEFNWEFTVEQIFNYSILIFYDLKNINITEKKFFKQLRKEMKLYSTFNAQERVNDLINRKKISV